MTEYKGSRCQMKATQQPSDLLEIKAMPSRAFATWLQLSGFCVMLQYAVLVFDIVSPGVVGIEHKTISLTLPILLLFVVAASFISNRLKRLVVDGELVRGFSLFSRSPRFEVAISSVESIVVGHDRVAVLPSPSARFPFQISYVDCSKTTLLQAKWREKRHV